MRSFKNCIGTNDSEIMEVRVNNFEKIAQSRSYMSIQQLKLDYMKIQSEIENMLDLGKETTTDLGSSLSKIDTNKLFDDLYDKADKLGVLACKIRIRTSIHNKLFPNSPIDDLTEKELDFLARD